KSRSPVPAWDSGCERSAEQVDPFARSTRRRDELEEGGMPICGRRRVVRPMRPLEQREGAIEPREACSRIGFRPRVRVLDQRVVDSGLGAWGEAVLRAPAARQKEQE